MAFKGKRGLVLRTTKPMKVKGQSLAVGTRVKYMAPVDKNTLKVKIQDPRYPKLRGEWHNVSFSTVSKVERGRPAEAEVTAKSTARKAPAKKAATKRPAAKKAATTVAATPATEPAAE